MIRTPEVVHGVSEEGDIGVLATLLTGEEAARRLGTPGSLVSSANDGLPSSRPIRTAALPGFQSLPPHRYYSKRLLSFPSSLG